MSEEAMLAYKQKVKIFQIPPNQFLIFMVKASFVPKFQALTIISTVFTCICRLCTFRMHGSQGVIHVLGPKKKI